MSNITKLFPKVNKSLARKLKEFIADLLDSICAETYEPKNYYLRWVDGELWVTPFKKD